MRKGVPRDAVAGGILIVLGIGAAARAMATLEVGTLSRMGPGMFPTACGILLALLGASILLPVIAGKVAATREGGASPLEARSLIAVLLALLVFAVMIRGFGMIPTITVMTLVAGLADPELTWLQALTLGLVLSIVATLVFVFGLELQVSAFSFPR